MPKVLRKLMRLVSAYGLLPVVRAALGACLDSCREQRFFVALAPRPACGFRSVWRRPAWRRFVPALSQRLGIAPPDFRRRAESAVGLDARPPETPIAVTVLLAGRHALSDARVHAFLLALAARGSLAIVQPGDLIVPQPGRTTLLVGIEANAEGQACLLELRRRGIACDWLAASDADMPAAEVPLREACQRQATPTKDATGLAYVDIAVAPGPIFHRHALSAGRRPLRILTYRWHVPHQYELFKLGAEFTLVTDLGESSCRWWDLGQRQLPANAHFARWSEIDPRQFDLAILHFDENVLRLPDTLPAIGDEWGMTFRYLMQQLTIPRIAVCHGSPRAADRFSGADAREKADANRAALVRLVGNVPAVVNSYQVQADWGFQHSRVIWHGFDPEEFPLRARPPGDCLRILTLSAEALADLPENRGASIIDRVARSAGVPIERLGVPEPNLLLSGNAYARAKFAHYVAALHRFDVYLNPTLYSPMPRSRGEAMLCGLATVSFDSHDTDRFIENGINGFRASSADELASRLVELVAQPELAWRIGCAGRDTAVRLFHIDRYLADWRGLIREVLGADAI